MEKVLKEDENYEENLEKYFMKLEALGELKRIGEEEMETIRQETQNFADNTAKLKETFEENFIKMQNRMRTIGTGLISIKTGKTLSDRVTNRYYISTRDHLISIKSVEN